MWQSKFQRCCLDRDFFWVVWLGLCSLLSTFSWMVDNSNTNSTKSKKIKGYLTQCLRLESTQPFTYKCAICQILPQKWRNQKCRKWHRCTKRKVQWRSNNGKNGNVHGGHDTGPFHLYVRTDQSRGLHAIFRRNCNRSDVLSPRSRIFAHVPMYSCHLEIHVWNLQIHKILGDISSIVNSHLL